MTKTPEQLGREAYIELSKIDPTFNKEEHDLIASHYTEDDRHVQQEQMKMPTEEGSCYMDDEDRS